ncbi:hypothetical protein B296_00026077 [Ensete ventricosum]|uniref:Uncharacterized protein n=1 Tax=Ensete ventricosum TaxID=4639 RepID=A0A427AQB1_ENSVE|nr:hypothetical protein B296_00026077 [Ensete ventricosum]
MRPIDLAGGGDRWRTGFVQFRNGAPPLRILRNRLHAHAHVEGVGRSSCPRISRMTESKDAMLTMATQAPVTLERRIRTDLEEHVPKPCECFSFTSVVSASSSFLQ